MEAGPNMQFDLKIILLQRRQFRYVLAADIEKMYRYIAVHPDGQLLQINAWRTSPDQPIREFQLRSVTYGIKSAPYLASKTLKQLAMEEIISQKLIQYYKTFSSLMMDVLCTNIFDLNPKNCLISNF